MGWPRFSKEGLEFWCAYFSGLGLPWYDGWHIDVGRELGRRIRGHPSHNTWLNQALHWQQEGRRRELRPEETEWMRWLRRQDCNYTRYRNFRGENELSITQWGDCALQLAIYNMIDKAEAVGYKQVRHHCREATTNQNLCDMWKHFGMNFEGLGIHDAGDVIEMYLFQMMESAAGDPDPGREDQDVGEAQGDAAVGESISAAENLFLFAAYALLLQYCPYYCPSNAPS